MPRDIFLIRSSVPEGYYHPSVLHFLIIRNIIPAIIYQIPFVIPSNHNFSLIIDGDQLTVVEGFPERLEYQVGPFMMETRPNGEQLLYFPGDLNWRHWCTLIHQHADIFQDWIQQYQQQVQQKKKMKCVSENTSTSSTSFVRSSESIGTSERSDNFHKLLLTSVQSDKMWSSVEMKEFIVRLKVIYKTKEYLEDRKGLLIARFMLDVLAKEIQRRLVLLAPFANKSMNPSSSEIVNTVVPDHSHSSLV